MPDPPGTLVPFLAVRGFSTLESEIPMPDKLITPTDLRNIARQLLHDGKMPSPRVFAEEMARVREEYVPAFRKLREQQKE
jgi:hypothetical protein